MRFFKFLLPFFLSPLFLWGQYTETFAVPDGKGITSGPCTGSVGTTCIGQDFAGVNWTLEGNLTGIINSSNYFKTINQALVAANVDQEVCWVSPVLNITGTSASFALDLSWVSYENYNAANVGSKDYIQVDYQVSGNGTWIPLVNEVGGGPKTISYAGTTGGTDGSINNLGVTGITGTTLQIRVCVDVNSIQELTTLDNIEVTGADVPGNITCDIANLSVSVGNQNCPGLNDGSLTVSATTSNGPITYSIAGPVNESNTTGVFTNLPVGTYTVKAADGSFLAGACELTTSSTIAAGSDSTPPTASNPSPTNIDCAADLPAPDPLIVTDEDDNCAVPCVSEPWINEFHYDNVGTDAGEFVEVAGPAGINLSAYSIYTYDGSDQMVDQVVALSGTIDNESNGFGAVSFNISGLQNGTEGIALVKNGNTVIEFLSYEGSFLALDGPAFGMTSTDVGVVETNTQAVNESLSRIGNGNDGPEFTWADQLSTPNSLNGGQSIEPCPENSPVVAYVGQTDNGGAGTVASPLVYTRTYSVTDASNNSITVTHTITLIDPPPVVTCPANISQGNDAGQCSAVVNFTATATDNCGGTPTITYSQNPGTVFPVATTTVTVTASDGTSTSSCSFDVTVTDSEPTISCPADITVPNDPGQCNAVVNYSPPVGTDNCPGAMTSQTAGLGNGGTFPIGATTETYTVTAANGQTNSCSFSVTVFDDEIPTITCLAEVQQTRDNTLGQCSYTAQGTEFDPTTTDNCAVTSLTNTYNNANSLAGETFPLGSTRVQWTTMDAAGNPDTCTIFVVVADNENPSLICKNASLNLSGVAPTSLSPSDVFMGAGDNCGTDMNTLDVSPATFDCDDVGTVQTVTLTMDDVNGNTGSCTAEVTITDSNNFCNQPPVAVCQDITVDADYNCEGNAAAVDFDGGSSDPDGDPITFSVSPEGPYLLGTTMVTLTVSDGQADDTCPATITVEDNTPPLFCGDSNASAADYDDGWQTGDNDGEGFGPWVLSTTTNDLSMAGHFIGNSTFNGDGDNNGDGDINTAGDRAWGLYANSGNVASARRYLSQDLTPGSTLRVRIDNGFVDNQSTSNLGLQFWSDNFTNSWYLRFDGGDSEYQTLNGDGLSFIGVPFTDEGVEVEITTISLTEVRATVRSLDPGAPAVYSAVVPLLNAGYINQIRISNNNVGMDPPRDLFINELSVCYADYDICPDVTVDADVNCQAVATYATTLFDNCAGEVAVQFNPASGSTFGLGATTVNGTASDGNGNTTTCSFTVTVEDNAPPIAICQDVTVQLGANGLGTLTVGEVDNNSTDNCGIVSRTINGSASVQLACVNIGQPNTVQLVVTDAAGNSDDCLANVAVEDNIPPVALCQNVTVQLDANGNGSTTPGMVDNGSNDACGIASLSLDDEDFTCADLGNNTVTLTVTDVNGNSSICTATVTVEDNIRPSISCPMDETIENDMGLCSAEYTVALPNAADNCGVTVLRYRYRPVDENGNNIGPWSAWSMATTQVLDVGFWKIQWQAKDASNNQRKCSFIVTVADTEDPVPSCPTVPVSENDPGDCGAIVDFMATATDNCPGVIFVYSQDPNTFFPVGTTTVKVTATDVAGNEEDCSFDVTVEDTEKPVLNCSGLNTVVTNDPGECEADVDLPVPTATDNCGVVTLEYRYRPVDEDNNALGPWTAWTDAAANSGTFPVGRYRIRWRAIDAAGNRKACTRFLKVVDVEPPIIDCFNQTIVFNGEASIPLLVEDLAEASDNCGIATLTLDINEVFCDDLGEEITVTATAVDVNGLVSDCTSKVNIEGLPCGWSQQPDGVGCEDGNEVEYDVPSESFTLNSTDCHNAPTTNTDEYAFAQYNLCGDGEIIAQVTDISGTSFGWAGVIMRESNDPQAKSVALMTNLSANHRREARVTTGGTVLAQLMPSFGRHWLRIQRFGNQFWAYSSFDGNFWTLRFAQTIPMEECIELGLVLNGYFGSGALSATFENVTVQGTTFFEFQAHAPVIEETVQMKTFSVFPNPTAGQVTIVLGDYLDQEARLEVRDVNGQLVQLVREGILENSTEKLDLGQLPAGMYFVQLQLADGTVQTQRVILQPRP